MRINRSTLFALASAAAFTCACGPSDRARNDSNPPAAGTAGASGATAAAADKDAKKPTVVLTGCLQEEKGMLGNYILTQASRVAPDDSVGTSGSEAKGTASSQPKGKVEERQMAQASRSYRLSGESDQLKGHIGHQIRVLGNLADKSELKGADNEVSQSDLAKVDVQSVEMIAATCSAKQ